MNMHNHILHLYCVYVLSLSLSQNSIRHNLSIRKNMFMKVYQYPPRRGNGSYWTLLSDGEEELKRAIPLFTTLYPPIIDPESVYNRQASTHTIKTKGQFIPLLPRSGTAEKSAQPYFAVDNSGAAVSTSICATTLASSVQGMRTDSESIFPAAEIVVDSMVESLETCVKDQNLNAERPKHLTEHNYARFPETDTLTTLALDNQSPELSGNFQCSSTPKRRKISVSRANKQKHIPTSHSTSQASDTTSQPSMSDKPTFSNSFFVLNTPSRDQQTDNSLHLLDSSILTPLKKLNPEIEIGPISLSPLYTNFVTPHRPGANSTSPSLPPPTSSSSFAKTPSQPGTSSSPFTPLKTADSGVFSPFTGSEQLVFRFSTPVQSAGLSPLTELFPSNSLNAPQTVDMFSPFKGLDASSGIGTTPIRLGSLQALGLPGLTPPPPNNKQ